MICVECGAPIAKVYRQFSAGNIRLCRCSHCGEFADPYVEQELILIVLDLLLLRGPVYRHVLFNRTKFCPRGIDSTYLRILILYLFYETYLQARSLLMSPMNGRDVDVISMNVLLGVGRALLWVCAESVVYFLAVLLSTRVLLSLNGTIVK